jgi:hypothetical protein
MALMTLQEAIEYAISPSEPPIHGLQVDAVISMHDDDGTVMFGSPEYPAFTFRQDLPLINWGQVATIEPFGARYFPSGWLPPTQVPGFSTRGQGGLEFNVATSSVVPLAMTTKIDLSVRRNPGSPSPYVRLWAGPSIQIEIETLSAAGTATDGVTLQAVQDGALLRAVGPSVRNHASKASYTFTIFVFSRPG